MLSFHRHVGPSARTWNVCQRWEFKIWGWWRRNHVIVHHRVLQFRADLGRKHSNKNQGNSKNRSVKFKVQKGKKGQPPITLIKPVYWSNPFFRCWMYLKMPCVSSPSKSGIMNVDSPDRRLRQGDVTWSRAQGVEEVWCRRKLDAFSSFYSWCTILNCWTFRCVPVPILRITEVGTHWWKFKLYVP